MVSRSTWAPPHMAVGYHPSCSGEQGFYPCYPIMPRFGLTGLGRGGGGGGGARGGATGARVGAGGGPMVTAGGAGPAFVGHPMAPRLGGRTFGRGFRFPSSFGPFFSDGSSAGWWSNWWPQWCGPYSYPFYSYPARPQIGLGRLVNPVVPRYGMTGLGAAGEGAGIFGTGILCWPPSWWPNFLGGDDSGSCTWQGLDWFTILFIGYGIYSIFFTTKKKAKAGYLGLEVKAQKRRKARAEKYRAKAKALEAKGLGGIFA